MADTLQSFKAKPELTFQEAAAEHKARMAGVKKSDLIGKGEKKYSLHIPDDELTGDSEDKVKKIIKSYFKAKGAFIHMASPNHVGPNGLPIPVHIGIPDFLICFYGRFIAIEAKASRKGVTTKRTQLEQLARVYHTGGHSLIVHSLRCLKAYEKASYDWSIAQGRNEHDVHRFIKGKRRVPWFSSPTS